MRSKVDAVDYKYYIEPNIPPIKIDDAWLEEIKNDIPMLQYDRIGKYMSEYELSRYDSTIIVKDKSVSDYFEEVISLGSDAKSASNWITTRILGETNKSEDITIENIFIRTTLIVFPIIIILLKIIALLLLILSKTQMNILFYIGNSNHFLPHQQQKQHQLQP